VCDDVFVCPHLAALAGMHAVMEARRHIATHLAEQHQAVDLCHTQPRGRRDTQLARLKHSAMVHAN
jgi:hypothetical protein